MALSLQNKNVLITGATSGLGQALAIELSKLGTNIIVHGRTQEKVSTTMDQLHNLDNSKHKFIICDLNKPETVAETFDQISEIDIVINNAGVWAEGDTVDISPERIVELTNVNLLSYLIVARTLLPKLLKREFSQILNVVSVAGIEIPFDYYHTIYSATKFGLQGFSEALAKEFDNKSLRVMGFYPGGMETPIFKKAEQDGFGGSYEESEPWMFDPIESVEAMIFMLTRNPKVNVKRLDLINHLQQ